MPIYEYKGQQYDIATEDQAAAKAKILSYLEKQGGAPAPAASDKAPSAAASALSSTAARDLAEAQARQDIAAKGPEQVSIPQAELADARRNVAALTRELARKGVDAGPPPAIGSSKAGDYLLAQRAKAQGQQPAPADVVPPAPPVAQTQLAPPAPAVVPAVAPKPVVAGRFGAFGVGPAARPAPPPQLSALEKAPKVTPVVSETQAALNMAGVSPQYVASLKTEFYRLPPAQRVAALQQAIEANPPNTVKGRAVRAVAADDDAWKAATSRTPSARLLSPRVEDIAANIQAKYPERPAELVLLDAQRAIDQGRSDVDYDTMQADVVGEQATAAAAQQAKELEDAGLARRAGAGALSGAKKSVAGLAQFGADLWGDKEFSQELANTQRIEGAKSAAIPQGEGVFDKSLQGAVTSLATQAPFLVLSALTGSPAPVMAQAGLATFGEKYGEGKAAGLGTAKSAIRAIPMAAAEVFFERFGMTKALGGLKAHIAKYGEDSVYKYVAKAIATELPSEMATTISQYGIDVLPGVGLNKKPSLIDLYQQVEETLRQTVLQAGITAGATVATVKGVQGARATPQAIDAAKERLRETANQIVGIEKTNEILGLREGAYERPGEINPAKLMAEMKRTPFASTSGTLSVPPVEKGPTEPKLKDLENVGMQEEEEPGLRGLGNVQVEGEPPLFAPSDPVKAEAQRKEAVAALANRIEQEQGIPIEDAERIAANDIAATEAQYRRIAGKGVDLTRMEEIARSHIVAGYPPPVAMEMAAKAVQEERAADALAKETGALDVRKPKPKTGRRGAGVAGEPGTESTAGPETTTRDGVVSTESDAGLAPTGEAPQPGALTETEGTPSGTETVKTEQTETQGQEKPAAVGKPPKAPKPAKVEPAKGDVHTFEEAQENNALGKPVRTGYNLLINGEKVGTYKTKRQAVAASNLTKAEKTGNAELIAKNKKAYDDAIASTGAGRPPRVYPRQKPPTATAPAVESEEAKAKREMDEARAEAAAQEESDRKKAEDFETGTAPKAEGPITVVETKLLKGDALTGASTKVKLSDGSEHEINRQDSITSMGLPGWHDVNAATINSYLADTKAEAIKELVRRQEEKRGAVKKPKGKKATSAAETLEAEAKEKLEELEDLLKNYNTNPDVASAKASAQRIYRIANDLGAPKAVRDRAKKILADEIDVKDIVTQNKDAIRASSAVLPGATPDAKFAEFKNASQAIAHVIKTGTKFQQALGNRLRGFVNGVKFVVVEKDQKVPEGLTGARIAKRWEKSIDRKSVV